MFGIVVGIKLRSYFFFIAILALFFAACKKEPAPVSPGEISKDNKTQNNDTLIAVPEGFLSVNDIQVNASRKGNLYRWGGYFEKFFSTTETDVYLTNAALWIGTTQNDQPCVNFIVGGRSNYTTKWGSIDRGVYHVTPEILKKNTASWPVQYGAPVDQNGNPVLYGDEMLFSCFKGFKNTNWLAFDRPIEDLRITQTIYAYKRADLRNIIFIRYELKNTGTKDLSEVYSGFYTDTDITFGMVRNSIGYDAERGMMYTYMNPSDTNSTYFYNCISGSIFLESPFNDSRFPYSVSGHRALERDYGPAGSQFGELSLRSQDQVFNVLKALANDGSSMIDPVTQNITKYAFTGDPLTGSGWLDNLWDSRDIMTTGPFNLRASESKVITVAIITVGEKSLGNSLSKLRSQAYSLRNEKSLWSFPVSRQ